MDRRNMRNDQRLKSPPQPEAREEYAKTGLPLRGPYYIHERLAQRRCAEHYEKYLKTSLPRRNDSSVRVGCRRTGPRAARKARSVLAVSQQI